MSAFRCLQCGSSDVGAHSDYRLDAAGALECRACGATGLLEDFESVDDSVEPSASASDDEYEIECLQCATVSPLADFCPECGSDELEFHRI